MHIDVHQHLLPAPLIEALRRRREPPCLRGSTLLLDGEPEYAVDPGDHDPVARAGLVGADGLDVALLSLSTALGIESLPVGEAAELLDAWHEGALALEGPFRAWASAGLREVDPGGLVRRLEQGFVGLTLPATALLDADGYSRLGPLLAVLEERGAPLFIHPGPAAARDAPAPWWPALVDYVGQMHAAWFAFRLLGRPRHPRLRVCFAMLAGLAPLHAERFAARAGERSPVDAGVFVDVSSYGTRAIDAVVRVLGIDVLVNGSDRPYAGPVEPGLGDAARHALRATNPARLLDPEEVSDDLAVAAGAHPGS